MPGAYYNEIDPNAAEWLRQLIKLGEIAPGDVDERDIRDVSPAELTAYDQVHLFAGVGVWSYALRSAGWPDDRPVWTGSAPCTPYSQAGKRKGVSDERALWWAMFWLISQCRPETVIGEQVSSKDGLAWWDIVQSDLEGASYAAAAFDLCAAGVGAPHIRQRLFWVANADHSERRPGSIRRGDNYSSAPKRDQGTGGARKCREASSLGNPSGYRQQRSSANDTETKNGRESRGMPDRPSRSFLSDRTRCMPIFGVEDSNSRKPKFSEGIRARSGETKGRRACNKSSGRGSLLGFWSDAIWLSCRDGKARPVKSSIFPLVNGTTSDLVSGRNSGIQTEATAEARTMRLKGYGNAIVAPLAIEFISACMEVLP